MTLFSLLVSSVTSPVGHGGCSCTSMGVVDGGGVAMGAGQMITAEGFAQAMRRRQSQVRNCNVK